MKLRRADIIFIALIPLVVFGLWLLTTEQTTVRIPLDEEHRESLQVYRMEGKKAAEQVCRTCHNHDQLPLSEAHPPEYRCMFCHKPADLANERPVGLWGNRPDGRHDTDEKGLL